jgi:uncharacterized protein YbbC (DUF1343 family)
MWFDQTAITWQNPSPNLQSVTEETLYPGVALIEVSNVSVGRGTDTPFEILGAPWIESIGATTLSESLNARNIPGVHFSAATFTPTGSYPYAGQLCNGITITIMDRNLLDSPEMGIEIVSALAKLYPAQFHLADTGKLIVNAATMDALKDGVDPHIIADRWKSNLDSYIDKRKSALLY